MRHKIAAVVGLLVLASADAFSPNTARAQQTQPAQQQQQATVTIKQVNIALEDKTWAIVADRIVLRGDKTFTLSGEFRIVAPDGKEYQGKDGEVSVNKDQLRLTASSRIWEQNPAKTERTSFANWKGVIYFIPLAPKTVYANTNNPGK